jgi:RNA polymerase sigma-70 factor, ECF subfamily
VGATGDEAERAALLRGDEAAFRSLIQRYHGAMLRLALTYVNDRQLAEDVVQESWITVLRRLPDFEGRSSLKTWVFGILVNVARARRRKETRTLPFASLWRRDDADRRRPTVDQSRFGVDGMWLSLPDSWEDTPESKLIAEETMGKVRSAIGELPLKLREVIELRDVAGLHGHEVSEVLGISEVNQRVRLHRARAAVRQKLEDYLR